MCGIFDTVKIFTVKISPSVRDGCKSTPHINQLSWNLIIASGSESTPRLHRRQVHLWNLFARHTTMTLIILYLIYSTVSTVVSYVCFISFEFVLGSPLHCYRDVFVFSWKRGGEQEGRKCFPMISTDCVSPLYTLGKKSVRTVALDTSGVGWKMAFRDWEC